ncbi:unnamed protein product, partial [Heterosigma akashiwo]
KIILGGDVNATSMLWNGGTKLESSTTNRKRGEDLENFLLQHDLSVLNSSNHGPTYVGANKSSYIDATFCSDCLIPIISDWKVRDDLTNFSDHRFITFNFNSAKKLIHRESQKYDFLKLDKQAAKSTSFYKLPLLDWFSNMPNTSISCSDVDRVLDQVTTLLSETATKFTPLKPNTNAGPLLDRRPKRWWSKDLSALNTMKNRAQKKWKSNPSDKNLKRIYTRAKAAFKKRCNDAKAASFRDFISQDNIAWPIANKLRKLRRRIQYTSNIRKKDGSYTTDIADALTEFADCFFTEDLPSKDTPRQRKIRKKIDRWFEAHADSHHYLQEPFTLLEIEQAFQSLAPGKSADDNLITAELVKLSFAPLQLFWLKLLTSCYHLGYFPVALKIDLSILLPKPGKDDYSLPKAYRPIAILPIIGKILEFLILQRLIWWEQTTGIYNEYQSGFEQGSSHTEAVGRIANLVENAFRKGQVAILIRLDVEQAFPSAWHPAIFQTLIEGKCPTDVILLLRSFLTDRVSQLFFHGERYGVPLSASTVQGARVSPNLW